MRFPWLNTFDRARRYCCPDWRVLLTALPTKAVRKQALLALGLWLEPLTVQRQVTLTPRLQRFGDDVFRPNGRAKQSGGNARHHFTAVRSVAFARHCGRCPGRDQMLVKGLAYPPHEQGHVRALPAAIGMQLIQDEEL